MAPMKQNNHTKSIMAAVLAGLALPASAAPTENLQDEDVADALDLELLLDDKTSFNNIDVRVVNGIATLDGESRHLLAKERAARIAESVKGVRSVVNLIDVLPRTVVSAGQLRHDVESALFSDPATDSYEIEVNTDADGKVTGENVLVKWTILSIENIASRSAAGGNLHARGTSGLR